MLLPKPAIDIRRNSYRPQMHANVGLRIPLTFRVRGSFLTVPDIGVHLCPSVVISRVFEHEA